jgi:transglutaminase-like putative cysteine protease
MTAPHPPGHLTERDFRSDAEKWRYLERAPEFDKTERSVVELAASLWEAAGRDPRAFAELAHAYARDVVLYMTDTEQFGEEDIAPAGKLGDVIERKVDDCDAKARLFVALCRAVRLDAEMVPHWRGDTLAHVSAKVKLPAGWASRVHFSGQWLPVELTLARARLGEVPRDVPKDVSGHWNLNEARI